jgi:Na+/melibiose symporter-like transporter
VLSSIGIGGLVFGLIQAPDHGWASASTLEVFAVAALFLAFFVMWEFRKHEPMLDMSFFRNPAFSVGSGGMVLVFLAMYGVMFLITQYLQLVHGYSPLGASLRLLPISPIMIVVATRTPRLSARFGAQRTVASGMIIIAASFVLLRGVAVHSNYVYVLICVSLLTSGIALAMSPMTASIMSAVPARRAGAGSAMNDATRELGAALGVAILGSIAASKYKASFSDAANTLPPEARASARSSLAGAVQAAKGLDASASRTVTAAAQHAFLDGIHLAASVAAVLAAVAAALVLRYLPRAANHEDSPSPLGSAQIAAELGLAGTPPVFASETAGTIVGD